MSRTSGVALALVLLVFLCGCVAAEKTAREIPDPPSVRPVENTLEFMDDRVAWAPPENWTWETPQCGVIVLGRVREITEDPAADPERPWRITFDVLECFKGRFGEERLDVYVGNPRRSLDNVEGPLRGSRALICARLLPSGEWWVHQYRGMRPVRSEHDLRPWLRGKMWKAYPETLEE